MRGLVAIFFTLFLFPAFALAQVSITTVGPAGAYTQNFNGAFLSTANYPLTDNAAGNLGWYAFRTAGNVSPNVFVADTGSTATSSFKNYGSAGSADRALGALTEGGGGETGDVFYGLRIQNDTGVTVRSVRVQYTGEQWRDSANTSQLLAFGYQVSAGDITTLNTGTYTTVTGLTFTSPQSANADAALDGNAAANRAALDQAIFVDIAPGSEIMLRWFDNNAAGQDHGLSIDDVTVTFFIPSAAGVSVAGRAVTAEGAGIGGASIRLSGGSLLQPMTAITSPFGYFSFDNVPAGATYIVEISSKRATFNNPTQVINVSDSIADIEFTASPMK